MALIQTSVVNQDAGFQKLGLADEIDQLIS